MGEIKKDQIFFNGQELKGKFTVAYWAAYYEGSHKWIMLTGWLNGNT